MHTLTLFYFLLFQYFALELRASQDGSPKITHNIWQAACIANQDSPHFWRILERLPAIDSAHGLYTRALR